MTRNKLLAGLITGALVVAGCGATSETDESERNADGDVVEGGDVGAFRLRVGDCIAADATGEIESVPVVPCDEEHDSEVFHAFDMPDGDFPGGDAIEAAVVEKCLAAFEPYVGAVFETSIWDIGSISPTQESWDGLNDREVLCTTFLFERGPVSRSAKDSAE